jgi:cytochrome c oxidase assembly protein subunit 15
VLVVLATFVLVIVGGTVTSKGAGMAVPDWPTTYDYNMYLFPPSMWVGGIFWEHVHRLAGATVGKLTIVLAAWLWLTQKTRPWLRWLGLAALGLVIVQGVMGGLRVREIDYRWGVVHGIVGQLFLAMLVLISAATSRWWIQRPATPAAGTIDGDGIRRCRQVKRISLAVLVIMLLQLGLGAAMRHSGAGLAIPDFPGSYGGVLPPMNEHELHAAIDMIPYENYAARTFPTVPQVHLHFGHRVWALAVTASVVWMLSRLGPLLGTVRHLRVPAICVVLMLIGQLALGASVIWSGRHPEIATAHQALGAALLATTTLLAIRIHVLLPQGKTAARATGSRVEMEGSGA